MAPNSIQEIEHTADYAIRIRSKDLEGLLKTAAIGMLGLMGLASEGEGASIRELSVTGIDREDLLVGWLTELLYLVDKYEIGISKIELTVTGDTKVAAIIHEIPSQMPQREIKAVTYHGLEVLELENGLEATIVFDV